MPLAMTQAVVLPLAAPPPTVDGNVDESTPVGLPLIAPGGSSASSGIDGANVQGAELPTFDPAMSLPPMASDVLCMLCRLPVDTTSKGVRLMSKSQLTWRCSTCNSKCTSLSTLFGGWPVEDFRTLTAAEQENFWRTTSTEKWNLKKPSRSKLS